MKIIGLDPGFASLGWALCNWDGDRLSIIDGGVIVTKPASKKQRSVRAVDDNLRRVREQAKWLIEIFGMGATFVCMEAFNLGPKGTRHSAAKQGGSTATIVAVCTCMALPLLQATPQEIKKAACGTAAASKDEVRAALTKIDPALTAVLGALPKTKREHCADAFGAVLACLDTEEARLCLAAATTRR